MAGFDRRAGSSTGVLDDLYVSALAIVADDGRPFVMCSFDLLGIDRKLCGDVRRAVSVKLKMDEEYVWVSATHTHSAPSGIFWGRTNYCAEYVALLCERSCAAAGKAMDAAVDADAALAVTETENIASLRDQSREQARYRMPLLQVRFEGAGQRTTLCRFACHATVLDERNTLFSRDLPGAAANALKDSMNCLFLNGACADLSTRYTRTQSSPEELARMGRLMASALESARPTESGGFGHRIRACRQTLHVIRGEGMADVERQNLLAVLRSRAEACSDAAARREFESRIAVLERPAEEGEPDRAVDVSAVNLGPLIFLGLPFEVSSDDGSAIEAKLSAAAGKPVYAICYTGGYDGYLPSGRPLSADSSYQDFASRYAPETRDRLLQCARACVDSLLEIEKILR